MTSSDFMDLDYNYSCLRKIRPPFFFNNSLNIQHRIQKPSAMCFYLQRFYFFARNCRWKKDQKRSWYGVVLQTTVTYIRFPLWPLFASLSTFLSEIKKITFSHFLYDCIDHYVSTFHEKYWQFRFWFWFWFWLRFWIWLRFLSET